MGDMGGPEQTAYMIDPVQPVIHKIFKDQQHKPVDPWIVDGSCKTMVIKKWKDETDINNAEQQVDPGIHQHHINILDRIFPGIAGLLTQVTEKQFQPNYY